MAEVTTITNDVGPGVIHAPMGRIYIGASLPTTPEAYYGGSYTLKDNEWRGGEIAFLSTGASPSGIYKLYIQTATSGRTATWKRYVTAFTAV